MSVDEDQPDISQENYCRFPKNREAKLDFVRESTHRGLCLTAKWIDSRFGQVEKFDDLIITKEIPSYGFLPYAFGSDLIDSVLIDGELVPSY